MPGYNQYIGMRYVPIVDGAWVDTKSYEPLTVVTYNGNSYISKTYAPAGTLPTNETYWILSANYNAQVEQYRAEVRAMQSDVLALNKFMDGIQDTIHPVDSVVELPSGTAPATLYGGNWQDIGGGVVDGVGNNINIASFNSANNKYTFNESGIVRLSCGYQAGTGALIHLFDDYNTDLGALGVVGNQTTSMTDRCATEIEVYKNWSAYVTLYTANDYASFLPFSYLTRKYRRIS